MSTCECVSSQMSVVYFSLPGINLCAIQTYGPCDVM